MAVSECSFWKRVFILAALFCLSAISALVADEIKSYSREISGPEDEYIIEVGGTIDPENVEITIENIGETPLVDPRLTVNGKFDWFDIHSMVAEIVKDCTTDEEKALAIWEWVHWKKFQRSPADHSSLHPVRAMNGYGYGICGHTAAWLKAMWTAAGLEARVQEIWGHTVSEAYYNGGWHMLDGNVKVFYLGRDNRTIASLAELEKDGWLIERTIHPREPWVRQDDPPERNEEFVRYIVTSRDNYVETGYDDEIAKNYTMSYTLKPGEKLLRWWDPVLGKYEARDKNPLVPQRYANGRLEWEPDLKRTDVCDYLRVIENITTTQRDGITPAIHVAEVQDENYTRPSRFAIPVASPYPIVGGHFYCTLLKDPGASASVFFGEPEWDNGNLYTYRWGSGPERIELDLDSDILRSASLYNYEVGFTVSGNSRRERKAQAGVEDFRLITDLQVSPHSLPALSRGKNAIKYRDRTQGAQKVRITHKWRERTDNTAPGKVRVALSPADGKVAETLAPVLKWKPAADPDSGDKVADYQVLVSLRPDCRWPVSMSLWRNIGSAACEWQVPASFLNPGTVYYWKVRARDSRGAVGEWGDIFSFKVSPAAK
ncbi:MAG: transglutaminase domain-containing protein [Candidatus Glassbacteria bacterium]